MACARVRLRAPACACMCLRVPAHASVLHWWEHTRGQTTPWLEPGRVPTPSWMGLPSEPCHRAKWSSPGPGIPQPLENSPTSSTQPRGAA
eukprot:2180570-Alexandrium_andersonii.AAC.1